jgi:hypothetical protein
MRLRYAILAGGVAGAAIGLLVTVYRFLPFPMPLEDAWGLWDYWLVDGLLIGALVGVFVWMVRAPRRRLPIDARCAIGINVLAWTMFLLFSPLVPDETFQAVARIRASGNAGMGTTDVPTVVAARPFGGWSPSLFPGGLASAMSGAFVDRIQLHAISGLYVGAGPTRRESYVIAAVAFIVSTAFWSAFGGALAWMRRSISKRLSQRGGDDVATLAGK